MFKNIVFDFHRVIFDPKTGRLNDGVLDLISSLRNEGYDLHLFTNTSLENIHKMEEGNPFIKFFENIVSCTESPKPSMEAFQSLLQILHCDTNEIVMIDDRDENIAVAKEFGIMGIVFTDIQELEVKLSKVLNDN